jgi:hypothetical protein
MKTTHVRFVFAAFSVVVAMLSASSAYPTAQQKPIRLNKIVEQEQGNAAISGQHWLFIDQTPPRSLPSKIRLRFTLAGSQSADLPPSIATRIVRCPRV